MVASAWRTMEAFLAVLHPGTADGRDLLPALQAGMALAHASGVLVEEFTGKGVAIAVGKRTRASDVCTSRRDGRLAHVQGCVRPLNENLPDDSLERLDSDKIIPADLARSPKSAASLTGSFHVLLCDLGSGELVAVNDRAASRQIYYYRSSELVVLSSDIGAVLAVPGVDCSVDLESLAQFVRLQTILGDRTMYRNIRVLTPASFMRCSATGCIDIGSYWEMAPLDPYPDDESAIRGVASAFTQAACRIAAPSGTSGILLSGGVDSRVVLAAVHPFLESIQAFTFGPEPNDESELARSVAAVEGVPWHHVPQAAVDYWAHLEALRPVLQAHYSLAHANSFSTASYMAEYGISTLYHGALMDPFFSGSYLPQRKRTIAGRPLYTYSLAPLPDQKDAVALSVLRSRDIQHGEFQRSFLAQPFRDLWASSAHQSLLGTIDKLAEKWAKPHDWFEKALISSGFSSFYTYPVTSGLRSAARERSPLCDSAIIDAYLRLSVRQRFIGPVYRRSLQRLNPRLARIRSSNTGAGLFDPPAIEALKLQARTTWRGLRGRVARLGKAVGVGNIIPPRSYGSYPSPGQLAAVLATAAHPQAAAAKCALLDGFLAQSGIVDRPRLSACLERTVFPDEAEAWTILALASLAAWFDRYPAKL